MSTQVIDSVKRKLRAAAYDNGGINWLKLFQHYDRDKSGEINYDEFKSAIRQTAKVSAEDVTDDQLKQLFNYVDKSGDGHIQYEKEFLKWLDPFGDAEKKSKAFSEKQKKAAPITKLVKGGGLSSIEIKKKLKAAAYDNGIVNWGKLFKFYDRDNSGEISVEEFKSAIRKDAKVKPEDVSDEALEKLFKEVDKDGDGNVQYDSEFLAWLDPNTQTVPAAKAKAKAEPKAKAVVEVPGVAKARAQAKKKQLKREPKRMAAEPLTNVAINRIKKRLRGAAFDNGQVNWHKLFKYYDRDNSGEINYDEFRQAIRKDLKVTPDQLSEHHLRTLFKHIDLDDSNAVNYDEEFVPWLEREDPEAERLEAEMKARAQAPPSFVNIENRRAEEISLLSQANQAYVRGRLLLPFLLRWINYIITDVGRITMDNFTKELRDGLVIKAIVERLAESSRFEAGINMRAISRPLCIANLDKVLSAARRQSMNVANMCRPEDVYEGRIMQIARCLLEMFESLQMRKVKQSIQLYLREIDVVLSTVDRPLLERTAKQPLDSGHHLIVDFGDGIRVMTLLVAYDKADIKDLAGLYGNPDAAQLLENAKLTAHTLAAAGFPVLLAEKDWATPPAWNFDLLLLQIYEVWHRLREEEVPDLEARKGEFTAFKFKDGVPLQLSPDAIRKDAAKAYDATRRALANEPPLPPLFKGAQVFSEFILNLGDPDITWEFFDHSGNGSISMMEFLDGARRVGFKGNAKRIFGLIDCNRSGRIERHELENFCQAALTPQTPEEEKARERTRKAHYGSKLRQARKKDRRQAPVKLKLSTGIVEFASVCSQFPDVHAAFDAFDLTDSNTVTLEEFVEMSSRLGLKADPKKIFNEVDLDKSGIIGREEFTEWLSAKMREAKIGPVLQVLVDFPEEDEPWPTPSVAETTLDHGLGEARIPAYVEEQMWMLLEESRRREELKKAQTYAAMRKVELAGVKALEKLVEVDVPEDVIESIERFEPPQPVVSQLSTTEEPSAAPPVPFMSSLTPTTSIAARVVVADDSERRMWIQTSVVDRSGAGMGDMAEATVVLEFREQLSTDADTGRLLAQVDVSKIFAIEQMGQPSDDSVPEANAFFVITAAANADLGGDPGIEDEDIPSLFHEGIGHTALLYVVAGPSLWRRQEAATFFEELRILMHFVKGGHGAMVMAGAGAT